MENSITRHWSGKITVSISKQALKVLEQYAPTGCPFKNYTMKSLLWDMVQMYDWKVTYSNKETPLVDFIKMLQAENNVYMVVYGDAIIRIIEGGWEESI